MLVGVISAALYSFGYERVAGALFAVTIAVFIIRSAYKNPQALGAAYCAGAMTGLAGMASVYSLAVTPLLLMYMLGPLQARSFRMTMAMLIGVATPFWIYLPYYLYTTFFTAY